MDLTFGKGGFIISHSNSEIINSRPASIKDLSDIESDLTEFISDEKNIADESSGEYWNPDLLIKNCTAEEWNNKFKNMLGAVVNFIPFSDNTAFNFDCTVLECFPVWVDNKYWKCDVKIKLASVLPVIPAVYSMPVNIFYLAHELTTAPVMPEGCIFYLGTEIENIVYNLSPDMSSAPPNMPFFWVSTCAVNYFNTSAMSLYVGDYIEFDAYVNGVKIGNYTIDGITENNGIDIRTSNKAVNDFTVNYLEAVEYSIIVTKSRINGVTVNDSSMVYVYSDTGNYNEYSVTDNMDIYFYIRNTTTDYKLYIRKQKYVVDASSKRVEGIRYDLYCDGEKLLSNIELLTGIDSYYNASGEGTYTKAFTEGTYHTWELKMIERKVDGAWVSNILSDMISPSSRVFKTRDNWY